MPCRTRSHNHYELLVLCLFLSESHISGVYPSPSRKRKGIWLQWEKRTPLPILTMNMNNEIICNHQYWYLFLLIKMLHFYGFKYSFYYYNYVFELSILISFTETLLYYTFNRSLIRWSSFYFQYKLRKISSNVYFVLSPF